MAPASFNRIPLDEEFGDVKLVVDTGEEPHAFTPGIIADWWILSAGSDLFRTMFSSKLLQYVEVWFD